MAFKQHVADKTNWRDMLKGKATELDMAGERDKLLTFREEDIRESRQDWLFCHQYSERY